MLNLLKSFQFVVLLGFLFTSGNSTKVDNNSDVAFKRFLDGAMTNYSTWLTDKELDPSPLTNVLINGHTTHVHLSCQLNNHYISGHSKSDHEIVSSTSNFAAHYFQMGRDFVSLVELHGEHICTGTLFATSFPKLTDDLVFNGQGNFFITTESSKEYLIMHNVGITQDYKLNLNNSRPGYTQYPNQNFTELKGQWNETLISSEYINFVQKAFGELYQRFASSNVSSSSFPSMLLLHKYVREIAESVNLTEIIDEKDLPEPFYPTPYPTTTSTTTTSTTPSAVGKTVISRTLLAIVQCLVIFYCLWSITKYIE